MMQHSHGHESDHPDIFSNTIFGFWVYLMTDVVLFATLFATYAVLRSPVSRELFNPHFALAETLVLLGSSFTCALAMLGVKHGKKVKSLIWFGVTFFLGFTFLIMVARELTELFDAGNSWEKSGFLSSYFTLVGTHWLHIAFGLIFLVVFAFQVGRDGINDVTRRRLTCLSLFWFFSYLIWIFMFTFVYMLGAS